MSQATFRPDVYVNSEAVDKFCVSDNDDLTAIPYVGDKTATWLREKGGVHSVTQVLKKLASYAQEGKGTLEVCGAFHEWLVSLEGSSPYERWLNFVTTAVFSKARVDGYIPIGMQGLWDALDDLDNAEDRPPTPCSSDPSGGAAAGAGPGAAAVAAAGAGAGAAAGAVPVPVVDKKGNFVKKVDGGDKVASKIKTLEEENRLAKEQMAEMAKELAALKAPQSAFAADYSCCW